VGRLLRAFVIAGAWRLRHVTRVPAEREHLLREGRLDDRRAEAQRHGEEVRRRSAPAVDLAAGKGQLSNSGTIDRPTLLADTSYGQGELLTSPLQMAMVAATVGNHGVQVQPHYVTEIRDPAGGVLRTVGGGAGDQIISAATAAKLTTYLVQAVEAPGAFAFGAKISGVHVAGKTGTAENPAGSPHGWFVGFAPAEDPQIAVAVIIENAGQGGVDAAPLGGAVMRAALGK